MDLSLPQFSTCPCSRASNSHSCSKARSRFPLNHPPAALLGALLPRARGARVSHPASLPTPVWRKTGSTSRQCERGRLLPPLRSVPCCACSSSRPRRSSRLPPPPSFPPAPQHQRLPAGCSILSVAQRLPKNESQGLHRAPRPFHLAPFVSFPDTLPHMPRLG